VCNPVVFAHLQCGIDPRTSGRMDCDVIDVIPCQANRPKRAPTSMCMEISYKCRFAWSFPSCFGHLCSSLSCITFLPRSLWIAHSLLFELSCELISRVQPGPMTCVSCFIGLRYVEPLSSLSLLLFFLLLFPCDARHPSQLLKKVSLIRRHLLQLTASP